MSMTMPQIVMLNHASWVNSKRMEQRSKSSQDRAQHQAEKDEKDPIVQGGKRLSELNSDDLQRYYADW